MPKPPTMGKDARPRIHLWPTSDRTCAWSNGPDGRRRFGGTAGQCVDEALATIDYQRAVILWEGTDIAG